jgi:hypothetical protein
MDRDDVYDLSHLNESQGLTLISPALKVALEKLGYNVYHCSECAMRWKDNHIVLFKEAMEAKLYGKGKLWTGAELDKVLQNYTVC